MRSVRVFRCVSVCALAGKYNLGMDVAFSSNGRFYDDENANFARNHVLPSEYLRRYTYQLFYCLHDSFALSNQSVPIRVLIGRCDDVATLIGEYTFTQYEIGIGNLYLSK